MTEENINIESNSNEVQVEQAQVNHIYYEIESDLLAKPNALADIVITDDKPTLVFCNQPSEADLVEVVLNKRQVSSRKLIGRVPADKVAAYVKQALNGEVSVLIVTDVSARDMDVRRFDRVINYAIHEDPEIYLHRFSASAATDNARLTDVLSLISPLDHGNFHYLKKVIDFDIAQGTLPAGEDIAKAQFAGFIEEAKNCSYPESLSDNLVSMIAMIKESEDFEAILKYLVHSTCFVLPELKVKSQPKVRHDNYSDRKNDSYEDRESSILKRNIPRKEYVRFYVGQGSAHGFNQTELATLMKDAANFPEEHIFQYTDRGSYSFVDVLKENSAGLVDILDNCKIEKGGNLVFKKAALIYVREDLENNLASANTDDSSDEEE